MSGDAADTQGLSTRDQWRLITRLQEQNALLEQEVAALRAQKARWLQGSGSGGGTSGLGGSTRTLRTGGPGSPRNMLAAPPDIPPITAPKTTATVAVQTDKELVCQTTFFLSLRLQKSNVLFLSGFAMVEIATYTALCPRANHKTHRSRHTMRTSAARCPRNQDEITRKNDTSCGANNGCAKTSSRVKGGTNNGCAKTKDDNN